MAVSKTTVLNKALTLCGASTIGDITDATNNARACNNVYEISLRSILCECNWNFSVTRATLTVTATTVMPWNYSGESYVYTKPSLCLKVIEIYNSAAEWREEGELLITDVVEAQIKYTYYHDDPSKYPGYFLDAFIDKLCSDISYIIINSASKAEAFLTKYVKVSLPKAMSANSQTGTQQQPKDDEWALAKYGNGGNPARSYS